MCVIRIALVRGKLPDYLTAVADAVHNTLGRSYDSAEEDMFRIIQNLEPDKPIFEKNYEGGCDMDNLLLLDILAPEQTIVFQQAFFGRVVLLLKENVQVMPETFMLVYSLQKYQKGLLETMNPCFQTSEN